MERLGHALGNEVPFFWPILLHVSSEECVFLWLPTLTLLHFNTIFVGSFYGFFLDGCGSLMIHIGGTFYGATYTDSMSVICMRERERERESGI